jgi:transcriptional regulator with XRE-family HTH domain
MSQLDLALEAEISSRHLSFIETGRSRPARAMVLRLGETLDLPLGERNQLLLLAGHAPEFADRESAGLETAAVVFTLKQLVRQMLPFPALIIDGGWNLVEANDAVMRLLAGVSEDLLAPPINVLRLSLHPQGLGRRIVNLATWRNHLMNRLDRQIAHSTDQRLIALADELRAGDNVHGRDAIDRHDPGPAALLRIEVDGRALAFLSATMMIGAPHDVMLADLAIETFLPADDMTRAWLNNPPAS